jgi:signal transduction histidine kinase
MKMEDDPKTINNYLNLQESSIRKMNDFIFDIIHIAKNARQKLESEQINFQQLVSDILSQHEFNEDSQKIEKVIHIQENTPFYSDPTRLKIILNNLISNAIQYSNTTKESPQLKIDIQNSSNQSKITIWDNGLGIPEEFQKKVFEMFFRGTDVKPGTGLGLYMVHEIVMKLGGTISLKSELGNYTEFTIELPQIR